MKPVPSNRTWHPEEFIQHCLLHSQVFKIFEKGVNWLIYYSCFLLKFFKTSLLSSSFISQAELFRWRFPISRLSIQGLLEFKGTEKKCYEWLCMCRQDHVGLPLNRQRAFEVNRPMGFSQLLWKTQGGHFSL